MGSIYEVQCRACDYAATVYEGAGMEAVIVPAVCRRCREVREASRPVFFGQDASQALEAADDQCNECGTKLQSWRGGDELLQPLFSDVDTNDDVWSPGPCPRCAERVDAQEIGIWD